MWLADMAGLTYLPVLRIAKRRHDGTPATCKYVRLRFLCVGATAIMWQKSVMQLMACRCP